MEMSNTVIGRKKNTFQPNPDKQYSNKKSVFPRRLKAFKSCSTNNSISKQINGDSASTGGSLYYRGFSL